MNIGDAAAATGVSTKMIRYHEEICVAAASRATIVADADSQRSAVRHAAKEGPEYEGRQGRNGPSLQRIFCADRHRPERTRFICHIDGAWAFAHIAGMLHRANQISGVLRTIGLMLIAAAFVLLPFGSSSVALASATDHASAHAAPTEVVMVHSVDHHADVHKTVSRTAKSGLDQDSPDHERDTCCEGFCVGSAALSSVPAPLVHPGLARKPVSRHASLEPGEWVPPFRPPSSLN